MRSYWFPEEIQQIDQPKTIFMYKDIKRPRPVKYSMDKCQEIHKTFSLNWENKGKLLMVSCENFWKDFFNKQRKDKVYYSNERDLDYPDHRKLVYDDPQMKELKSNFVYCDAGGTIEEQKMDRYWADQMNKELAEKREAKEFQHFMKNWADAKSRFESEIQRKMGQKYSGSQCDKRSYYYFDPKAKKNE